VYENGMLGRSERTNRVPHPACKSTETACLGHKPKRLIIRGGYRLFKHESRSE
jgi:hypothetical protein